VKVLAIEPHLFYVAFIGQSIVAASQVFILSLPAKLAAVWFGPNQVSSACSIGVFGNQVSDCHNSSFKLWRRMESLSSLLAALKASPFIFQSERAS
jgi:hypothetical protein